MNALSVFVGICAFFSASFVGLWMKKRLIKKADFYKDYYDYLCYASERIGYERTVVSEINETFHAKSKEFTAMLNGEDPNIGLTAKELEEIKTYLSKIGSTDAETQLASLASRCSSLKRFVENDCATFRKDAALRFKLSVLVGVALFIIVV